MKNTLCIILLLGLTAFTFSQEAAERPRWNPEATYTKSMYTYEIEGTLLRRVVVVSYQSSTSCEKQDCTIGFLRQEDKDSVSIVVPLVTLPTLTNDSYEIKLDSGVLYISEKSSRKEVVQLNLKNLAPDFLVESTEAEQDAAPQIRPR